MCKRVVRARLTCTSKEQMAQGQERQPCKSSPHYCPLFVSTIINRTDTPKPHWARHHLPWKPGNEAPIGISSTTCCRGGAWIERLHARAAQRTAAAAAQRWQHRPHSQQRKRQQPVPKPEPGTSSRFPSAGWWPTIAHSRPEWRCIFCGRAPQRRTRTPTGTEVFRGAPTLGSRRTAGAGGTSPGDRTPTGWQVASASCITGAWASPCGWERLRWRSPADRRSPTDAATAAAATDVSTAATSPEPSSVGSEDRPWRSWSAIPTGERRGREGGGGRSSPGSVARHTWQCSTSAKRSSGNITIKGNGHPRRGRGSCCCFCCC